MNGCLTTLKASNKLLYSGDETFIRDEPLIIVGGVRHGFFTYLRNYNKITRDIDV